MKKPDSSPDDKIAFKEACTRCTAVANIKKKEYFKNVISKSNSNPRKLYQLVNEGLDRKQNVSLPDYTDNVEKITDDFNIVKIRKSISSENPTPHIDDFPSIGLTANV